MNNQLHQLYGATGHGPLMGRQRGAALFIALIALVSMTIAGIALVRSVDTTNLIAGNLAFRQAALHASDTGVERAFNELGNIVVASQDANWPAGCAVGACNYYASMCATNARGVPAAIVWANVPVTPDSPVNGYNVRYVIDRLCNEPAAQCNGPLPVNDLAGRCYADTVTGAGTKKAGGIVFAGTQAVYYRVTVRVEGPRNTVSLVQAIFSR